MGFPLMEMINGLGGGMLHDDRPLKACVPGGISVPVLRAEDCEVDLDFDSLAKKGSALGSAGIMVMDSSTCMVQAAAANRALLRPRVVRPVHALPRGLRLDDQAHPAPHRGRQGLRPRTI